MAQIYGKMYNRNSRWAKGASIYVNDIQIVNGDGVIVAPVSIPGSLAVAGTLSSTGNFSVNGNFTVAAASGNTVIAGTLHVTGVSTLAGVSMTDATNVVLGTTTGTKFGTSTTQKIGFYNATPVVQPATTGTTTGFTAGSGTAVNDDSTFTGGTGATAYRISDMVLAMKNLGILAA